MSKRRFSTVISSDEEDTSLSREGEDQKLDSADKHAIIGGDDDMISSDEESVADLSIFNKTDTDSTNFQLQRDIADESLTKITHQSESTSSKHSQSQTRSTNYKKPNEKTSTYRKYTNRRTATTNPNQPKTSPKPTQPKTTVPKQDFNEHQLAWIETTQSKNDRMSLYSEVLKPENFCKKIFYNNGLYNICSEKLFRIPIIHNPLYALNQRNEITRLLYMSPEQCLNASDRLCRLSDKEYSDTTNIISSGNYLIAGCHGNTPADVPKIWIDSNFKAWCQEGAHRIIAAKTIHKCNLIPILVTFNLSEEQAKKLKVGITQIFKPEDITKQMSSFSLNDQTHEISVMWRGVPNKNKK
jgi:hypothetical protein